MIKLTKSKPTARELVIRIDGQLTSQTLKQFEGELRSEPGVCAVTLDLSGVTLVDPEGRGFLIGLREAGCRLLGASLYIRQLLEEV